MKEFISIIKDARLNQQTQISISDYHLLYELSKRHKLSPLVYNQVYNDPSLKEPLKSIWQQEAFMTHVAQTIKTDVFLHVYQKLQEKDIQALVFKGIIMRNLYVEPDNRPSGDEDVLVQEKDFEKAKQIILDCGLTIFSESATVTTFEDKETELHIELHRSLFSGNFEIKQYQDHFNHLFDDPVVHQIQDVSVLSFNHDLHMLFLLMHYIKHFLHGGVGIRQLVDIVMYAEKFGKEIDWQFIYETLEKENVLYFTYNLFMLAHDLLDFDFNCIVLPKQKMEADYETLLEDIMDAGIYGKSTAERKLSSSLTSQAMRNGKPNVLRSIFPTSKQMKIRNPYLNKYPFLLPVAYIERCFKYLSKHQISDGIEIVKIGNERTELLKKYRLILPKKS